MISVIICSTNAERLDRVCANIDQTIGVAHEFVVRNNSGSTDGICKVYNELAAQAQYEVLCFVHEDVMFLTPDWGKLMFAKAVEPNTGIIGFSGAAIKTKTLSGQMHKHYGESSVIDGVEGQPLLANYNRLSTSLDWARVVIVDGVLLFMRKAVWEQLKFDQTNFNGFHLYDLDISTAAIMAGYDNYICHKAEIVHFFVGNYSKQWYEDTKIYHQKWGHVLPLYINRPSDKQIIKDEHYMFFNITYHLLKRSQLDPAEIWHRIKHQLSNHPFYHKTYYQLYRYLKYKIEYNRRIK